MFKITHIMCLLKIENVVIFLLIHYVIYYVYPYVINYIKEKDFLHEKSQLENYSLSIKCKVIDIGVNFIWIHCQGNLGPTYIKPEQLSKQAKYKIINNDKQKLNI